MIKNWVNCHTKIFGTVSNTIECMTKLRSNEYANDTITSEIGKIVKYAVEVSDTIRFVID